ncbi:MAG: alkaline phosphatase [Chitinivibrionales bacterium]|nr:alkaline phosphatase [Chitinivibrionales bacterium]MBD3356140.1 alkaline phosphatase [Chitinivibrionales bacterium]
MHMRYRLPYAKNCKGRESLVSSRRNEMLKKTFAASAAVLAMAVTTFAAPQSAAPKNIVVMIPDGCGPSIMTLARWKKGAPLAVDQMTTGLVKTDMANSVITGSAAAATAFATSFKTTARYLGLGPDTSRNLTTYEAEYSNADLDHRPLATVLEAARLQGKAVGLISTSRITHATPAAYASHIQDRGWDNDIMEHMVHNDIDVVFGGGARHLIPSGSSYTTSFGDVWDGRRTDGQNLMDVLADKGYKFVDSKDGMASVLSGKVWGLFDDSHMDADLDRNEFHPTQPTIAEMTQKAIEILSQDPDGFFLMVEGSQVDWGGHNNDPIYMVTDFLAFDSAVQVAKDFADANNETSVIGFPDHNCGGMDIGNRSWNWSYTGIKVDDLLGPLAGMKLTSGGVEKKLGGDYSEANIISTVQTWWGITLTSPDVAEIQALQAGDAGSFNYALARYVSKTYTGIGWTSHGHNGEDVPLWTWGTNRVLGTIDNTKIASMIFNALGMSVNAANNRLFRKLTDYTIEDDDPTEYSNPTVVVSLPTATARMEINRDVLEIDNGTTVDTYDLEGLVVKVPATEQVWVPQQALDIMATY